MILPPNHPLDAGIAFFLGHLAMEKLYHSILEAAFEGEKGAKK